VRGSRVWIAAGATGLASIALSIVDIELLASGPCRTAEGRASGSCQAIVHRSGGVLVVGIVAAISIAAAIWSKRREDWRPSGAAFLLVLGASAATGVASVS